MDIRSHASHFPLSREDETYIRSRVIFALTTNQPDIGTVNVWLVDIPATTSRGSNHCRIEVTFINGQSIIGDSSASDLYVAIDRAVDRAAWKTARSLESRTLSAHQHRPAGTGDNSRFATAYRENSI